ncbi:purinergic receptor P2X4 isoform a isoform 4-like protein [Camelus ferus]|nr:purinergic receptor P2X4 isoform a isoform 4-like protein [Camelus ferus]
MFTFLMGINLPSASNKALKDEVPKGLADARVELGSQAGRHRTCPVIPGAAWSSTWNPLLLTRGTSTLAPVPLSEQNGLASKRGKGMRCFWRWVFVWEKGYQETDSVVSSVTTKAKGVTVTNTSKLGFRIWDVADYVIPPQEENSLFIMTNMIFTVNQTQGLCPEIPDKKTVCKSDADCAAGSAGTQSSEISRMKKSPTLPRVATGRCVLFNETVKTCEVAAWCPVEDDAQVPKRNILPNITTAHLKSCIYDAATDPFCPIFRLGKIVEDAGHSFQDMAVEGGIMGIQIKWDCNLDRAASLCLPKYSFRRLDTRDVDHNVSPGYNFRFAKYYHDPTGTEHRTLIKAYGIRFDIIVFGKAGKFDIIPTMINIGSGLALLGVATVLCDVIVLYCMKKRYYYREKKYKYVEDYEQKEKQDACVCSGPLRSPGLPFLFP